MNPLENLEKLGYLPLDMSLWEQNSLRYLKLQDKNGRIIYVDLEEEEVSFPEGNQLKQTKNIIAPNSLVRGSLTCVEPESRAVAIECEGGVCIFSRENRFNLEEKNFSCQNTFPQYRIPSSCPVIKYKELVSNPVQIEKCVETCSERITCSEMKFCEDVMKEIPVAIHEIGCSWKKFETIFCEKKKLLMESIAELEKYRKDYEEKGMTCKENYKIILYNLKVRREKLASVMLLCKNLILAKEALLGMAEEINSNCCWMDKELSKDSLCTVLKLDNFC